MIKKFLLISTVLVAGFSGAAHAQDAKPDHRSASAKAQDMYVEPTIRVTTRNQVLSPEQASAAGVRTFSVPVGTGNSTQTQVYDSKGQLVNGQAVQQQAPQYQQPQQAVPAQQGNVQRPGTTTTTTTTTTIQRPAAATGTRVEDRSRTWRN